MINELKKICEVKEEFDLTKHNTYRLNSVANALVSPNSMEELTSIIKILNEHNAKYFVLGNGSNIILPPYYDGVIIKLDKFNKCTIDENETYVECGYMLNKLAMEISNQGFTGMEWATGVPGSIGGGIYMNAGCYGSSMSEVIKSVCAFDGTNIIELKNEELNFGYRTSIFKEKNDLIILSCKLKKLDKGNLEEIKALIQERTEKRVATQDLSHPSCGSVFRNPEGMSAGKLIDDLGLKGYKIGDAMVSLKHANFIINDGNATSEDIISLIKYVQDKVKETYNVDLILEQEIIK